MILSVVKGEMLSLSEIWIISVDILSGIERWKKCCYP